MKSIVWVILGLAVLGAGLYYYHLDKEIEEGEALNFSTWKVFQPRSGLFKVALPNVPQYAKDFLPSPDSEIKRRYDMYASEKVDGTLFLISVITYPSEGEANSSEDLLRENINELLQHKPGNQIKNIFEKVFQTHKAYDFTIENKEFHVEGMAIQASPIVYMLTYITRNDSFDPIEYQHFIDSFQILDKNAKK